MKTYGELQKGDRLTVYGVSKTPATAQVTKIRREGDRVRLELATVSSAGTVSSKKFEQVFSSIALVVAPIQREGILPPPSNAAIAKAIGAMLAAGKSINRTDVARQMGISVERLDRNPCAAQLVAKYKTEPPKRKASMPTMEPLTRGLTVAVDPELIEWNPQFGRATEARENAKRKYAYRRADGKA